MDLVPYCFTTYHLLLAATDAAYQLELTIYRREPEHRRITSFPRAEFGAGLRCARSEVLDWVASTQQGGCRPTPARDGQAECRKAGTARRGNRAHRLPGAKNRGDAHDRDDRQRELAVQPDYDSSADRIGRAWPETGAC